MDKITALSDFVKGEILMLKKLDHCIPKWFCLWRCSNVYVLSTYCQQFLEENIAKCLQGSGLKLLREVEIDFFSAKYEPSESLLGCNRCNRCEQKNVSQHIVHRCCIMLTNFHCEKPLRWILEPPMSLDFFFNEVDDRLRIRYFLGEMIAPECTLKRKTEKAKEKKK